MWLTNWGGPWIPALPVIWAVLFASGRDESNWWLQNTSKCQYRVVYLRQKFVISGFRRGVNEIFTAWLLKMGPVGCPETSVTKYKSMLRNTSEDGKSHLLQKSRSGLRIGGLSSDRAIDVGHGIISPRGMRWQSDIRTDNIWSLSNRITRLWLVWLK